MYSTHFTVVVDHKPFVTLYSKLSPSLSVGVARHKSKVACFDFDVIYDPGEKNLANFDSRNPVVETVYSRDRNRRQRSTEWRLRYKKLLDAVMLPLLEYYSKKDKTVRGLYSGDRRTGD